MFNFPVQLTTSRIGNLIQLIHTPTQALFSHHINNVMPTDTDKAYTHATRAANTHLLHVTHKIVDIEAIVVVNVIVVDVAVVFLPLVPSADIAVPVARSGASGPGPRFPPAGRRFAGRRLRGRRCACFDIYIYIYIFTRSTFYGGLFKWKLFFFLLLLVKTFIFSQLFFELINVLEPPSPPLAKYASFFSRKQFLAEIVIDNIKLNKLHILLKQNTHCITS